MAWNPSQLEEGTQALRSEWTFAPSSAMIAFGVTAFNAEESFEGFSNSLIIDSDSKWKESKQFLIDQAETLHDVEIVVVSPGSRSNLTLHCYRSLCGATLREAEFGVPLKTRVLLKVQNVTITEEFFLGILLETIEIDETCLENNMNELLDLCEILKGLQMKKILWYVVEKIREVAKSSISLSFNLFKEVFERFESVPEDMDMEVEEDEDEIQFSEVITVAAFDALRISSTGNRLTRGMKHWLMRNLLLEKFQTSRAQDLRSHPQLRMTDLRKCLSSNQLLSQAFEFFSESTLSPNVGLLCVASNDRRSVLAMCHIEALALSYEFIRMMLRFDGRERQEFLHSHTLILEDLSVESIKLLTHFAYVGQFPRRLDVNKLLFDLLLILRKAEAFSDERLRDECVQVLKRLDTSNAIFLDSLLSLGNAFEDVQSRDEILEAWVSQGHVTMKKLSKQLDRSADQAIQQFAMADHARRIAALERENQSLRENEQSLREALQRERERIDALEEMVAKLMMTKMQS